MNDYPVWWDQTITVYNKYEDPTTNIITWYRHVLHDCFWKYNKDVLKIGETSLETSNIICRIPKYSRQGDPAFKERFEWISLVGTDKQNYFTLGPGDIIVRGDISDNITEYTKGYRSSDLIAKYKDLQGCMQIEAIAINTGPGRCNEHYYAQGN